jgi:hypothetical protein
LGDRDLSLHCMAVLAVFGKNAMVLVDVLYISSHGFDMAYNRRVESFISFTYQEERWQR